jgi:hypothetical protein
MSSESVSQVARSWMDVGSFHTRLFGVVYVTWGEAAALRLLHWNSSARLRRWNLLVQGRHWWFGTLWLPPVSKNEIEAERMPVWYHWVVPGRIAESAWHSDRKGFPGSVPKREETVGPVSTCGRELLRGWWRPIGLIVSFMIFTASVRNILDTPSYVSDNKLHVVAENMPHRRLKEGCRLWNGICNRNVAKYCLL